MSGRPLIGLSGRRKTAGEIIGTPESLTGLEGDWYFADYARGVLQAGGLPVNLPLDVDPALYSGRLDGVLLSGGADVGPGRYNAEPLTDEYPPEPERDSFELALLASAADSGTPVLGICRGLQLMNVFAGGTLHQDVPAHARYDQSPDSHSHSIDLVQGSALHGLYGSAHNVNSLHHQTVDRLGSDLRVTAVESGGAADAAVEGIEHTSLPMIAVQWHPEMLATRDTDPVFAWLVEQAARVSGHIA